MSLIDDAQNTMAAAFLGCPDPADRLRYAAVALAQADMLTDPAELQQLRDRITELETAPPVIWRAEHESIPLGTYRTKTAAKDHCEQSMRQAEPTVDLTWVSDSSDDDSPEDLCFITALDVLCTGYAVVPVEVQDAYDPEADQ